MQIQIAMRAREIDIAVVQQVEKRQIHTHHSTRASEINLYETQQVQERRMSRHSITLKEIDKIVLNKYERDREYRNATS